MKRENHEVGRLAFVPSKPEGGNVQTNLHTDGPKSPSAIS